MTIITALHHLTRYDYDRPIMMGAQVIRLRPAPHARAFIQSYALQISPQPHFINWQQDPFGNYLARIVFPEPTRYFEVAVDLVTSLQVFNPFDFFLDESAQSIPFKYDPDTAEELIPYLEIKENGQLLRDFLAEIPKIETPTIDFLVALNQRIYNHLKYVIRLEHGVQSCEDTLRLGSGSCRDMAWLLCQVLRHLGMASRFASGYLIQLLSGVTLLDGPKEDFTDLHAWCEVYLPGAGWVGLDPTSGLFAGEGHIPLCCTPNPSSAAPISGAIDPCESTMRHAMTISRIHEDHSVSKPYPEHLWQEIDNLGQKIDQDLNRGDVRLTMGGEPTFVSLDERDHPAWETQALGGIKKELSYSLFNKLIPNGAIQQFSQGKWYPGEILPRWAMSAYYRVDNVAIWHNPKLLAKPDSDNQHDNETAKTVITELAKLLNVNGDYILPAFEDIPYYLWKDGTLPIDNEIKHDDPFELAERSRLQNIFAKTYNDPVGYVLPLFYSVADAGWKSTKWQFKRDRLVLLAGDSPVGLRLPLSSLPIQNANEMIPLRSPINQTDILPNSTELLAGINKKTLPDDDSIRTAICAQVRCGTVHLFLPPLFYIEHFLTIVAVIESVCAKHNIPVVLEGYAPPRDLRVEHFSITPDPGVIEVNIKPSHTWDELKQTITKVYETAHESKLVADKFLLDGRRVGTGGGNHIVMGGSHPDNSPFLRRPDLLKSMLIFWQNHPSLSYLFSGQFIGPTSQAPRIDEARMDSLYELDIALSHIPLPDEGTLAPFQLNYILRNLLVDLTGNTHRSEFCIDKLYSPDSERGRLGLLEMRGFEMTPHPQMNLLQSLLIRACIAAFWHRPYRNNLTEWGTRLHDQFMLPYFIWQDFCDVLNVLKQQGYNFDPAWFVPFLDFRFPHYGTIHVGDVQLDLRMALEPWPVMGEENNGSGTSRGVDTSVERLQVSTRGLIAGRHIVTCNLQPLPLVSASSNDHYVAGVRYKAWSPPSCLHPNLPINTPLVFDIIDVRYNRSLGGCKYHVMHPGGRNYDRLPINENEAEGRRLSRFEKGGHSTGHINIINHDQHPAFPCTLDLRRGMS